MQYHIMHFLLISIHEDMIQLSHKEKEIGFRAKLKRNRF